MNYPLFFKPVYKEIIWGGRNLERIFGRDIPEGNLAESWELCCHKNGMSIVSNGELQGKRLEELILEDKKALLGSNSMQTDRFPLLVKILDANDKLSLQVHPNDEYALGIEGDLGKTEAWYILEAREGAKLIYGVRPGTTREGFKEALESGKLEEHLNFIDVKKGDTIFIPSGTVHAIMDGIVLAEIQQNSDTTYRVYDWNRRDKNGKSRELHIDKALDVINFDFKGEILNPDIQNYAEYSISNIVKCQYFTIDKVEIASEYIDATTGSTFFVFIAIKGCGRVIHKGNIYNIKTGDTFLIPANMGEFKIEGQLAVLKSYI